MSSANCFAALQTVSARLDLDDADVLDDVDDELDLDDADVLDDVDDELDLDDADVLDDVDDEPDLDDADVLDDVDDEPDLDGVAETRAASAASSASICRFKTPASSLILEIAVIILSV